MARTLNIQHTLERIYAAQERIPHVDDLKKKELQLAIDAAVSVVVIYLKLGREPAIKEKHWAGVKKLDSVMERC
ncbi:hypothetical protein [Paraburkholderia sp. BL10I2N1]|uniref:hypothetical protein n=1 Tax=Paraburkholderia sp. BL10I2N1 TaxID=1938796 RepID=UPI00105DB747|nr:hypothetical protein [Paraburkholderia sp. BL10I2N1]TDN70471.1 hypothetical protein B0G77_3945 [Paraburkholderia sp. BL10I2N1]